MRSDERCLFATISISDGNVTARHDSRQNLALCSKVTQPSPCSSNLRGVDSLLRHSRKVWLIEVDFPLAELCIAAEWQNMQRRSSKADVVGLISNNSTPTFHRWTRSGLQRLLNCDYIVLSCGDEWVVNCSVVCWFLWVCEQKWGEHAHQTEILIPKLLPASYRQLCTVHWEPPFCPHKWHKARCVGVFSKSSLGYKDNTCNHLRVHTHTYTLGGMSSHTTHYLYDTLLNLDELIKPWFQSQPTTITMNVTPNVILSLLQQYINRGHD